MYKNNNMPQAINTKTNSTSLIEEKLKKIMDKDDKRFIANESFEDRWAKGIPLEEARTHLLKTVRNLWK
jgi:hypothetical protein